MANPTPLPITTFLETRDGTSTTKDARITNMIAEKKGEETHFLKRPGYAIYDGGTWASNPALGAIPLPDNTILSFAGVVGVIGNATVQLTVPTPPPFSTYSTFNPSAPSGRSARITLSNGNLTATSDGTANQQMVSSMMLKTSGKWYCEFTATTTGGGFGYAVGIVNGSAVTSASVGLDTNGYGYFSLNGQIVFNNVAIQTVATYTSAAVISVLFDADAKTLAFWKNSVQVGTTISGIAAGGWMPAWSAGTSAVTVVTVNFGASAFTYTPPAGYTGWGI